MGSRFRYRVIRTLDNDVVVDGTERWIFRAVGNSKDEAASVTALLLRNSSRLRRGDEFEAHGFGLGA